MTPEAPEEMERRLGGDGEVVLFCVRTIRQGGTWIEQPFIFSTIQFLCQGKLQFKLTYVVGVKTGTILSQMLLKD